jgi:DnaJ-class molecular chaperone
MHEDTARYLTDFLERRRAHNCAACGRPNPVCDADLCAARLKHTCPECRGAGIFHTNGCSRRQARATMRVHKDR